MNRGQGTIEYLVILAVVVIVALIVVTLMINSTAPAAGISGTTAQITSASNPIAINETIVDTDGNYFLKIKNNTGENATITEIEIGDSAPATPNKNIPSNAEEAFILSTENICEEGQLLTNEVTITYNNQYNLTKKQTYPLPINFECENYTATITYTDEDGVTHDTEGGTSGGQTQVCNNSILEGTEVCDSDTIACTTGGYNGTQTCLGDCTGYDTCVATESCGDGIINGTETCDDTNIGTETCITQGFASGTLTCNAGCDGYDTTGCSTCPTNLVSYWGAEGNTNDLTGTNNATTYGSLGYTTGIVGQAFNMSGNNYVMKTGLQGFGPTMTDWTWTTWIYRTGDDGYEWVNGIGDSTSCNGTRIELFFIHDSIDCPNGMLVNYNNGTGHVMHCGGSGLYSSNTWYHVAMVFDAATQTKRAYVNGNEVINEPMIHTSYPITSGTDIILGSDCHTNWPDGQFIGRIDSTALFDRNLSEEEIDIMYQTELGGVPACS